MRTVSRVMVAVAACLAVAATAADAASMKGPCAADAEKLCQGVPASRGQMMQCLRAHRNEVSDACKQRIAKMKSALRELRAACHADAQKSCKGVAPGGGRLVQCLMEHEAELSPACKKELAQRPLKR